MSLSRNSLASLLSSSEPLIVHHWDADGVVSAVTTASFASGRADFMVPPLTYSPPMSFIDEVARRAAPKDLIVVADYNVSGEFLAALVSRVKRPVVVVDHHVATYPRLPNLYYYNPAAEGDPDGIWPSTAHVIADALGFYDPLLIATSIYGDLDEEAPRNPVFRYYMDQVGLDPERDANIPRDCALQIWGAEAAGEVEVLSRLAYELTYGGVDPCQAIMSDPRLTTLRMRAEEEVENAVSEAVRGMSRIGKVAVYSVELSLRVSGMVARRLLSRADAPVVALVAREAMTGASKIYIRGDIPDPVMIIKSLRSAGLRASGKSQKGNNVIVIDVGAGSPSEALQKAITLINSS